PWLRGPNTLMALHRLADRGHLSVAEYGALTEAHVFMREAEHRLQLHRNQQRSAIPSTPRERRVLARSLGYRDGRAQQEAGAFMNDLERHAEAVRGIYDAVLGRLSQGSLEEVVGPDPFLDSLSDHEVAAYLKAHALEDPASLLGRIRAIARLLGSPAVPVAVRRGFRHVTPLLLKELARAWSPVRALRTLDRFLVSIALDRDALEAFVGRQEIVAPLVQLFS